ncbi:MAG: hypothetical protein LC107_07265, partial [Chitinophagales bacterium]|nr:hypothetical protein [Chitinophagales bacterium]
MKQRYLQALLMVMTFIWAHTLVAQTTVTIGSGTTISSYSPNYYLYSYSYSQTIYLASEVNAGGWSGPGKITKIRYKPQATTSTVLWQDWVVYIGNTTKTSFANTSNWEGISGMTKVFDGKIPANVTANQWMEITLDTPFEWDGVSNLVFGVDENSPNWGNSPNWAGFTPGGNRCIYYYSDGTNPDPSSPPTGSLTSVIGQVQFDVEQLSSGGGPVPCDIDYKFSLDNGTGNTQTLLFADDFDVPANTDMTISKVTFRILNDISMATNIRFYSDNAGNPGTLIQGFTNIVPASKTILGTNFGYNFYDMVFNLPTSVTLSTGRYWAAIQTAGGTGLNFWAITYNGIGAPGKYSADNGVSWVQNSSAFNFGFRLDGQCLDTTPQGGGIECLLVCSNDQTITLAPGTCEANVNYLVTTIGSLCDGAISVPVAPFSQLTSFPVPIDDALDCNVQVAKHSRAYPARAESFSLTGIDVGSWSAGQQRVNVFAYTGPLGGTTLNRAQMTLIYQTPYFAVPGGQQVTHYDFPVPAVIPAGTAFVIEQEKGVGNGLFVIASTYSPESAPSYMTCTSGDTPENYANFGYSFIHLYQVLYGAIEKPGITIEQTSGIPSGDVFPVGTTTNCFKLINKDGVAIDSCCFDITIKKYPNPTKTLVCNDYLYISADENCEVSLNADMFLEGGPYGCYDDYTIMIWPFGYEQNKYAIEQNKPLYIPLGEHMYEIIDPSTGNRCWGSFKIEDKLAPVAECSCEDKDTFEPITGSFIGQILETDPLYDRCNFIAGQTPNRYSVHKDRFYAPVSGNYSFQITTAWTTAYYIYEDQKFNPANPCANVVGWLDLTATPSTLTVNLEGGKKYILVVATRVGAFAGYGFPIEFTINVTGGPGQLSFVTNPSDDPQCQFKCYDLETVQAETVSMLYKFPGEQNKAVLTIPPAVTDGCGAVDRTFVDQYIGKGMCEPGKLRRQWTFTDASGNKSHCTQVFTFNPIDIINDLTP